MNSCNYNNQLLREKIETIIKNIRNSSKKLLKDNKSIEISKNILLDYYKLIEDVIPNKTLTIYLLHIISREINNSSSLLEKELLLTLLTEFYVPFINTDISLTDPYLSRILTSIQSNILSEISPLYIGEIFKKIILYIFDEDWDSNREIIYKDLFEICQGFCLYNMSQSQYNYQLSGVICLNFLLNEIDYSFLNIKNYMIYIWQKIDFFLNCKNFEPKEYLLKYLFDFISKFRVPFRPYVNLAIYKILEFLDNKNSNIRKNSLNVLSILVSFYPNEIKPIKSLIIQLLIILSNDKNENIRNKSLYVYNKIEKQFSPIDKTINRQEMKNNKNNIDFYGINFNNGEYKNKILDVKNEINNTNNNRIHSKRIVVRKPKIINNLDIIKNVIKKNFIEEKNTDRQYSSKSIENRNILNRNKIKENKRYYKENTLNVNQINYNNENEIRFRDLLNIVKKKNDNKYIFNYKFSNLKDEVKKNNDGLQQLRKIKSEKVLTTI